MSSRVAKGVLVAPLLLMLAAWTALSAAQNPLEQLIQMQREYHAQFYSGRIAEAEKTAEAMIAFSDRHFRGQQVGKAIVLRNLAEVRAAQGRFREAEEILLQALRVQESLKGAWDTSLAVTLDELGDTYEQQGRYQEAIKAFQRSLAIRERAHGANSDELGLSLARVAGAYRQLGNLKEAELLYKRAMEIGERKHKRGGGDLGADYSNLAAVYHDQARYDEAERFYKKALPIYEQAEGDQSLDIADVLNNLGALYTDQGRYQEAEEMKLRVLETRERLLGPNHPDVASILNNLAGLYRAQERYHEALALLRRATAIDEQFYGPDSVAVCTALSNLSNVLNDFGRYREAEPLQRRALAIRLAQLGPEHPDVALSMASLGLTLESQNKMKEAEPLLRGALAIREKAFSPDHPQVSASLSYIADLLYATHRREEATTLYQRVYEIDRRRLGEDHPAIAVRLADLGDLSMDAGENEQAEQLYRRALAIREQAIGADKPGTARLMERLANFLLFNAPDRLEEAEQLYDGAIGILSQSQALPHLHYRCYCRRGYLKWKTGDKQGAVDDARQAMEIAESQRGEAAGGEQETARYFARYSEAFEDMVRYQVELGDLDEALAAAERGRARSLLDEMQLAGADLLAGLSEDVARELRTSEADAKRRVAECAKKVELVEAAKNLSPADLQAKLDTLYLQVAQARQDVAEAYRAIRNASPAYKLSIGRDFTPVTLRRLQRWVRQQDAVYLQYMVHETAPSYVLVISSHEKPRVIELNFNEEQAEEIGVTAGFGIARKLQAAMQVDQRPLIELLAHPNTAAQAATRLALLWELLVPEPERKALTKGNAKRLIVVPDGPLALLPFDTLVVVPGESPTYLLDVGPPIQYGASATLLINLRQRQAAGETGGREPVLTVGDPKYESGDEGLSNRGPLTSLTARSRYRELRGSLMRRPYSGLEAQWVAKVFADNGINAKRLLQAEATEAQVRVEAPGRRIVHLACHGLTDQSHGNLFGSLVLTPGKSASPDNDGFLTLAEIYGLPLDGCELAVLSACNTNFGPRQQGEGVWALSRGFLVAGARRVVASNWVVDDRAGASLISYFCGGVAQQQGKGNIVDYAAALHDAKRWVRSKPEWNSPYYWGTFALVGPD